MKKYTPKMMRCSINAAIMTKANILGVFEDRFMDEEGVRTKLNKQREPIAISPIDAILKID
jgi:hypothetical protein